MPRINARLLNADAVDALPASLLRSRRNAHARTLSRAGWLLRLKDDGHYLATLGSSGGMQWLEALDHRAGRHATDIDRLLALLGLRRRGPLHAGRRIALRQLPARQQALPPSSALLRPLLARLAQLGIDAWLYRAATGLPLLLEPGSLALAGHDRYQRPLWLVDGAARAWLAMRAAAQVDGVTLEAISGFRSHAYQHTIFRRKLARGQSLAQILGVNAAPGFSEHHSGRALDIGTTDEPPAEETFETTEAFDWLRHHAARFGFRMSYPRDNPHGIVYEPWHWYWVGGSGPSHATATEAPE
jgi:zinc D-Ala-D-Ala carboxypeptidase